MPWYALLDSHTLDYADTTDSNKTTENDRPPLCPTKYIFFWFHLIFCVNFLESSNLTSVNETSSLVYRFKFPLEIFFFIDIWKKNRFFQPNMLHLSNLVRNRKKKVKNNLANKPIKIPIKKLAANKPIKIPIIVEKITYINAIGLELSQSISNTTMKSCTVVSAVFLFLIFP